MLKHLSNLRGSRLKEERMANCPNCNGVGKIEGPPGALEISVTTRTCPTCRGSGEVATEIARWWNICDECGGWGKVGMPIAPQTCPSCRGRGRVID
jgi:DnaJ-class molecular chaperone